MEAARKRGKLHLLDAYREEERLLIDETEAEIKAEIDLVIRRKSAEMAEVLGKKWQALLEQLKGV